MTTLTLFNFLIVRAYQQPQTFSGVLKWVLGNTLEGVRFRVREKEREHEATMALVPLLMLGSRGLR
jgi:hypothetical protein